MRGAERSVRPRPVRRGTGGAALARATDALRRERPALRSQRSPAQRRQGRRPTDRSQRTRERVLQAAAACIAEEGFAAAHTNRIAQRAGVSWGVLQYHFGDKAGLLGAVLERGMEAVAEGLGSLEIRGEGSTERVAAVVEAGWRVFGSPLGRAATEILVNTRSGVANDPRHEERLREMTRTLTRLVRRALREALGPGPGVAGLDGVLLAALRGFALALMMQPRGVDFAAERALLAEMIAAQAAGTPRARMIPRQEP